jgi:diguanylate cyclase (GGDEF)-like protein
VHVVGDNGRNRFSARLSRAFLINSAFSPLAYELHSYAKEEKQMVLLSVTCIMIQLSIFLLFSRFGKISGTRATWMGIAFALSAVPLAAISYRLLVFSKPGLPLLNSLPYFASFLSAFGTLFLVPFLLIVSKTRETRARELIKANQALQTEIIELRQAEEKLQTLSFTDDLTGLFNRRGFLAVSEQQIKIARRRGKRLLLLYIDVDDMKQINDTFGHHQGDAALIATASILRDTFRESDIIARVGGDEFVVLAIDPNELPAEVLAHRLRQKCVERNDSAFGEFILSLSVGSTYYDPQDPCSIEDLMARADRVMYRHKREKNRAIKKRYQARSTEPQTLSYKKAAG